MEGVHNYRPADLRAAEDFLAGPGAGFPFGGLVGSEHPLREPCRQALRNAVDQEIPLITDAEAAVITGVFKDRWRTLMSVDDVIGDVIDLCEELKVADNTYFLYSSDQ